jgi:hypothetical protein
LLKVKAPSCWFFSSATLQFFNLSRNASFLEYLLLLHVYDILLIRTTAIMSGEQSGSQGSGEQGPGKQSTSILSSMASHFHVPAPSGTSNPATALLGTFNPAAPAFAPTQSAAQSSAASPALSENEGAEGSEAVQKKKKRRQHRGGKKKKAEQAGTEGESAAPDSGGMSGEASAAGSRRGSAPAFVFGGAGDAGGAGGSGSSPDPEKVGTGPVKSPTDFTFSADEAGPSFDKALMRKDLEDCIDYVQIKRAEIAKLEKTIQKM